MRRGTPNSSSTSMARGSAASLDVVENAISALRTLEAQFEKQWKRIDEHGESLKEMDKEITLIQAKCRWIQDQKLSDKCRLENHPSMEGGSGE